MRKLTITMAILATAIVVPAGLSHGHAVKKTHGMTLKQIERFQVKTLAHAKGVVRVCDRMEPHNYECWWHRKQARWVSRELGETRRAIVPPLPYWTQRQINIAVQIAEGSSGDPWPNCPDPYDGSGASWFDTVACENGGNWYDSPGYYRCGLQFDPGWERQYGRLCP